VFVCISLKKEARLRSCFFACTVRCDHFGEACSRVTTQLYLLFFYAFHLNIVLRAADHRLTFLHPAASAAVTSSSDARLPSTMTPPSASLPSWRMLPTYSTCRRTTPFPRSTLRRLLFSHRRGRERQRQAAPPVAAAEAGSRGRDATSLPPLQHTVQYTS
jgi:hypothetical protein